MNNDRQIPREMQISEAELRAMTAQMNEMHHASFPKMYEALTELGHSVRRRLRARPAVGASVLGNSRRRLLLSGGGLVAGSVLLAACGDDEEDVDAQAPPVEEPADDGGAGADTEALKLDASIEALAIFAYTAALEAAPKGKFGDKVPDAVAFFATHAKMQHEAHQEAFNAALQAAGEEPFNEPTPGLAPTVTQMFEKVDSVPALANLALLLENTAAATYTSQMGDLTTPEAVSAVATIAPVERQHAAILYYVLGQYPAPETFVKLEKTDNSLGALNPDALEAPA